MPRTQNRAVMIWIFTFTAFAAFLVVYGGFVRLTRSGLSITQWNPISGAVPPLNQPAWQAEFAKYQQTPEFKLVNFNMTLDQYKTIFWVEWLHRFIARIAGFVFAIPFFVFLFQKNIPWKEVGWYIFLGILFVSQAILGWYMVASGLEDRPSVSHYLLASHMLLALTLIGISLWTAFGHLYGFSVKKAKWSLSSKLVLTGFIILLIQICYGSFTAGLKAGYISDTWPLMLGKLIPSGLLSQTPTAVDESRRRAADGRVHSPLVRIYWLDNRDIFLLAHSKTELLKRYKIRTQSYTHFGHHPNCIGYPDRSFTRADRDCVTASSQCPAPLFFHNLSSSSSARRR